MHTLERTSFRSLLKVARDNQISSGRIEARDLAATSHAKGGAHVPDSQPLGIIGALSEESLVAMLNPIATEQGEGNAVAPIVASGAVAEWLAENDAAPLVDLETHAVKLTPKRVGCAVRVSKQLLFQAPGGEEAVKRNLRQALGEAIDGAILGGSGSDGTPIGLLCNPAVPVAVTFGGAAQLADIEEFSKAVRNAKVSGPLTWCVSPATASKWRQIPAFGDETPSLWSAAREIGTLHETTFAAENRVLLGDFRQLWVHTFHVEIVVDGYTRSLHNQVEIVANAYLDFAPLHGSAFARSGDAGNQ
mgnify:CR=1 FL=1|jgi:Phage capsid family.